MHVEAAMLAAQAGKAVPLARLAKQILDAVEKAGVFGGYLEDLVYPPNSLDSNGAWDGYCGCGHARHIRGRTAIGFGM